MRIHRILRIVAVLAAVALFAVGCSDDDSSTNVTDPGQLSKGGVILLMHDAPIDDLSEIWLTVNSIRLIGDNDADDDTTDVDDDSTDVDDDTVGVLALDEPIRMNLLALDSISRVLAVAQAPAGNYRKIRLYVSDPKFVMNDSTEVMGDDIKLVANGKVDLNAQGDVIVTTDAFTVVSIDLDAENSIQVNQTGNGMYIMRPQVFVDATVDSLESVEVMGAEIVTFDEAEGQLIIDLPGSDEMILVDIGPQTEIRSSQGLTLDFDDLVPGEVIDILGALDTKRGQVLAQELSLH